MSADIAFVLACYVAGLFGFRYLLNTFLVPLEGQKEVPSDWVFYACWFVALPVIVLCLVTELIEEWWVDRG